MDEEIQLMATNDESADPYILATFYTISPSKNNFPIKREKNFKVDNIDTFLNSWEWYFNQKIKFKSPTLNMTIKLPISQAFLYTITGNHALTKAARSIVYAKLQYYNVDEAIYQSYYYFVEIPKNGWKSKNTVEVNLYMDTLNTYGDSLTFDSKTQMIRDHRDRFYSDLSKPQVATFNVGSIGVSTMQDFTYYLVQGDYIDEIFANEETFEIYNYLNNNLELSQTFRVYIMNNSNKSEAAYFDISRIIINKNEILLFKADGSRVSYNTLLFRRTGGTKYLIIYNLTGYYAGYLNGTREQLSYWLYSIPQTGGTMSLLRSYDFNDEGINAPTYKVEESEIINGDSQELNQNWYLIYKTDSKDQEPLNGYLIPERSTSIKRATSFPFFEYTTKDPDDSTQPLINPNYLQVLFASTAGTYILTTSTGVNIEYYFTPKEGIFSYLLFDINADHTFKVSTCYQGLPYYTFFDINKTKIADKVTKVWFKGSSIEIGQPINDVLSAKYSVLKPSDDSILSETLNGIYELDRTDVTINKIIKCPYCPANISIKDKKILFSSDFSLATVQSIQKGSQTIEIKGLKFDVSSDVLLSNTIETGTPLTEFNALALYKVPNSGDYRNDLYESKLYTSAFYYKNFVYDSFAYAFSNELQSQANINDTATTGTNLSFDFYTTTTMNSRFLVHFNGFNQRYSTENYENYLTISRNNEFPIYTNAYMEYLKTGYNYDVKSKNLKVFSSIAGGISGVIGGAEKATSGQIVSGSMTIGSSIVSSITGAIEAERSFQQKQIELQRQKTSVETADDIDLLQYYSNNRFKLCTYQVSDNVRQQVANLFYYCGYKTTEIRKPNTTGRIWFNFVQCEPIFELSLNLDNEILEDLKNKFREGCTYLHQYNGTWDWNQERENYETWIMEANA